MNFDSALFSDVDSYLNDFGETVYFMADGVTETAITAVIERKVDAQSYAPRVRAKFFIYAKNSETGGISMESLNINKARVRLLKFDGGTEYETRSFSPNIHNQDGGMVYLELV